LKTEAYYELVKIADSWEDIAQWMGAEFAAFKATIEEYNSFCATGYDKSFAKDRRFLIPLRHPPYYAAKIQPLITDTIGPIRINERMEVLNKQNNPIPGLYAAGVITSGWQSDEYCSEICGSCMGFSVNSGRIAGENATKYSVDSKVVS
jgi:fumarate reductase flavoprotein subunit